MPLKGKELIKLLEKAGWKLDRIQGSHHIMVKGDKTEVIPCHNKDIPIGLLNAIKKEQVLNEIDTLVFYYYKFFVMILYI